MSINILKKVQFLRTNKNGKINKRSKRNMKYLNDEKIVMSKMIYDQLIQEKEKAFKSIEKNIKDSQAKLVKIYNKNIRNINNEFLKSNLLKWNIVINEINKYHDNVTITISTDGRKKKITDLEDYASSGQKRIIAIILASISIKKGTLLVLDDVVTSLDTDNIEIFKDVLINIMKKKMSSNFIFLTHSYTTMSKMGATFTKKRRVKFFGMDNISNKNIIFEFPGKETLDIREMLRGKTINENIKTLFTATLLREVIDNYILKKKRLGDSKNRQKILEFKGFLERTFRHYKSKNNLTFKEASEEINNNFKDLLDVFDKELIESLSENHSNEKINDFVLRFNLSINFKSLLDYVSQKYVYSLKGRFTFEKKVLEKMDDNFRNEWENNKILGILSNKRSRKRIKQEKQDIFCKLLSHNHLNNLRWTPIIESPIYKMQKYLEILEKDDYT